MNRCGSGGVEWGMKSRCLAACAAASFAMSCGADEVAANSATNAVADLGTVVVEGSALSKYRPETVDGATFTDLPPEKSPTVVDTLTEDFIREHNPTDLHDLLRYVPGVETGGKSLLIRQPGTFQIRGMGLHRKAKNAGQHKQTEKKGKNRFLNPCVFHISPPS